MSTDEILRRIEELLRHHKITERAAVLKAGVNVDFVRDMRRTKSDPKVLKLKDLATVLGVSVGYLIGEDDIGALEPFSPLGKMEKLTIRGCVQAGVWTEAIEWPISDHYEAVLPTDSRYGKAERFGLIVRGDSMDRLYPDGSLVIAVRYQDIGRLPRNGDKVVVLQRSRETYFWEATLKQYEYDKNKRHILWPRSTSPEFQNPIILPDGISTRYSDAARLVKLTDEPQEIVVSALVTASYRQEDKF